MSIRPEDPDPEGWRCCAMSDTGLVRERNEDAYGMLPDLSFYAVADGLGGLPGGEVASRVAMEAAIQAMRGDGESAGASGTNPSPSHDAILARLDIILAEAGKAVTVQAEADPSLSGMGTTLSALCLAGAHDSGKARFAHIGDSRIYALRHGGLEQVTEDHTVAMELRRSGDLSVEEAMALPAWHQLTRAILSNVVADGDHGYLDLDGVSAILLCTDGLSNMVPDAQIAETLASHETMPMAAAAELVRRALNGGGVDNITVTVLMRG